MSYRLSLRAATGVKNERISPHPVPLPMGEGTLEILLRVVQASLLPWGEGQDEGSEFRSWQGGETAPGRGLS